MTGEAKRLLLSVWGGVALLWTIVSTILLIIVRDETVTITTPTFTPSVTTSRTPDEVINIGEIKLIQHLVQDKIDKVLGSYAPVITSIKDIKDNVRPAIPHNMIQSSLMDTQPLQVAPNQLGFCALTPDANSVFTSMKNGEVSYGKWDYKTSDKTFQFDLTGYKVGDSVTVKNRIMMNTNNSVGTSSQIINPAASAVGAVGHDSIKVSQDGKRLYTAYIDSTYSEDSSFPFGQFVGKIQVSFNRNGSWLKSPNLTLDFSNPIGTRTSGLANNLIGSSGSSTVSGYNSFTEQVTSGDMFGQTIKTSVNSSNGLYMVGVLSNMGPCQDLGRCVYIMEEQNSGIHECVATLFLPSNNTVSINKPFSNDDRNSFGRSFDIVDDTCLVSMGSHKESKLSRIAYFKRDNVTQAWNFISTIDPPEKELDEYFGMSIVISYYKTVALIGSPPGSTTGIPQGGHVYVYVKNKQDIWELSDTVKNPWTDNTGYPDSGAFGWYVHTDSRFTIVSVTGNQNSLYTKDLEKLGNCSFDVENNPTAQCKFTDLIFFAFDQEKNKLISEQKDTVRLFQMQELNSEEHSDPTFGSNVTIVDPTSGVPSKQSEIVILTGTPVNNRVSIYTLVRG